MLFAGSNKKHDPCCHPLTVQDSDLATLHFGMQEYTGAPSQAEQGLKPMSPRSQASDHAFLGYTCLSAFSMEGFEALVLPTAE